MKKKTLAIVLVIVIAAVFAVVGTVAWLTDKTDPVKNTFVAGEIGELDLYETNAVGTEVTEGSYLVMPGVNITKDPTVEFTVDATNPDKDKAAYVFVKMNPKGWTKGSDNKTFTISTTLASPALSFTIDSSWNYLLDESGAPVYYKALADGTGMTSPVIAGNLITVSGNITEEELLALNLEDNVALDFYAYAIQQAGFSTVTDAWNAVKGL